MVRRKGETSKEQAARAKASRESQAKKEREIKSGKRKVAPTPTREGLKKELEFPTVDLGTRGKAGNILRQTSAALEGRPIQIGGKEIQTGLRGTKEQEEAGLRTKVLGEPVAIGPTAAATGLIKGFTGIERVSPSVFQGIQSRIGLSKLSGTASNIQKGKLVTIPGREVLASGKNANLVNTFASNAKSTGLTKKLLIGAGFSLGAASLAKDLFGTYPFASFGKEETLQSISFVMNKALDAGLIDEAEQILAASNEIVNATPTLSEKIPYANVQKEFQRFVIQQTENNEVWAKIIEEKKAELEQEESDFAKSRRESDEAAFERKRAFGEEESARFEGIRKEGEARTEAENIAESERFAGIEEENRQSKLREQALDSEYFRLIRERKFEEAEELLQTRLAE